MAHEVISLFIAPDSNEKWLWVQLFQLFAAKTGMINLDGSFGVPTGPKVLLRPVCVSSDFWS
jgi:hypothetical protein